MANVQGVLGQEEEDISADLDLEYDGLFKPRVEAIHTHKHDPVKKAMFEVSKQVKDKQLCGSTRLRVQQALSL